MYRVPFSVVFAAAIFSSASAGFAVDVGKHFEPGKLAENCSPCHVGHGAPRTPMLRADSDQMCLSCHQSGASEPGRREELGMGTAAAPADIRQEFVKPVIHRGARCVDCHSVHGIGRMQVGGEATLDLGRRKPSTKRGFAFEAELCLSCHGTRAVSAADPHDIGLLFDSRNPSFHPVMAIGVGEVPSLLPPLTANSMINCTDCHTNDDAGAAQGPHGSRVSGLLGSTYADRNGQPESSTSYLLCYRCHDRQIVLDADPFPLHRQHVVDGRTPCSLCHDPHGATAARALIRFNELTAMTGVLPSSSGRLEYLSESVGSGACYVTCHGVDHDPLGYGPMFTASGQPKFVDPDRDGAFKRPLDGVSAHPRQGAGANIRKQ